MCMRTRFYYYRYYYLKLTACVRDTVVARQTDRKQAGLRVRYV